MPYVLLFVLLGYMTYVMSSDYSSSENFLEKYPWLTYSDYVEAVEQADEGETAITIIHYNEEDGTTMHLNIGTNAFEDVVLPDAMSNKFSYMSIAGTLLLILTASVFGTEYKWGTIRQTLARGTSRNKYLGSKFLTLLIIALGFIIIATILAFIASAVTTWLITGGISWDFLSFGFIVDILSSIGLVLFVLFVYICFTDLFTILFKSSTAGIITSFLFFQIEGYIVMSMMSTSYSVSGSGVTTTMANPPEWLVYTIGYNIQYLWAYISPDSGNEYLLQQTLTTGGQSVLVLSMFCIIFVLASFYIFRRQDLTAD
ncbi:MAG: ABC transporter permease [Bacteroidales bacterium]|jgi:ABC-type transport system involved in multi-copper enzyme maturation permease subunit